MNNTNNIYYDYIGATGTGISTDYIDITSNILESHIYNTSNILEGHINTSSINNSNFTIFSSNLIMTDLKNLIYFKQDINEFNDALNTHIYANNTLGEIRFITAGCPALFGNDDKFKTKIGEDGDLMVYYVFNAQFPTILPGWYKVIDTIRDNYAFQSQTNTIIIAIQGEINNIFNILTPIELILEIHNTDIITLQGQVNLLTNIDFIKKAKYETLPEIMEMIEISAGSGYFDVFQNPVLNIYGVGTAIGIGAGVVGSILYAGHISEQRDILKNADNENITPTQKDTLTNSMDLITVDSVISFNSNLCNLCILQGFINSNIQTIQTIPSISTNSITLNGVPLTTTLNNYVLKSGSTMTGTLTINGASGLTHQLILNNNDYSTFPNIKLSAGDVYNGAIGFGGLFSQNYTNNLFLESTGKIILNTNGNSISAIPNFIINTDGNVGIGVLNPIQKLTIGTASTNTNVNVAMGIRNSAGTTSFFGTGAPGLAGYFANNFFLNARNDLVIYTDGQTAMAIPNMIIKANGNVGIGVSNPSTKLEINGGILSTTTITAPKVNCVDATGVSSTTLVRNFNIIGDQAVLRIWRNSAFNPAIEFIWGATTSDNSYTWYWDMYIGAGAGTENNYFVIRDRKGGGGVNRLIIDDIGNVGIGTTTNPSYKLNVDGALYASSMTSGNLIMTGAIIGITTLSATNGYFGTIATTNNNTNVGAPTKALYGDIGDRLILYTGSPTVYPYSLGINTNELWYSVPSGASHKFYIDGVNRLNIDSVGITSLTSNLNITSANLGLQVNVNNTNSNGIGGYIVKNDTNTFSGFVIGGSSNGLYTKARNNLYIYATNSILFDSGSATYDDTKTSLIIHSSGNIGINNPSPSQPLWIGRPDVVSDGAIVVSKNTGGNRNFRMAYDGSYNFCFGDYGNANNNTNQFKSQFSINYQAPANCITINSSGNVGISNRLAVGTTTINTGYGLQVVDSANYTTHLRCEGASGKTAISIGGNGNFHIDAPGIVGGRFCVKDGSGNVGIGVASPNCKLDVRGIVNITNTNPSAVPNGKMQAGSLTIGDCSLDYGNEIYTVGGGWTGANTAGLLLECSTSTEIVVHDSGNRLTSLMAYYGGITNTLEIGRNMGGGWDKPAIQLQNNTTINGNLTVNGTLSTNHFITNTVNQIVTQTISIAPTSTAYNGYWQININAYKIENQYNYLIFSCSVNYAGTTGYWTGRILVNGNGFGSIISVADFNTTNIYLSWINLSGILYLWVNANGFYPTTNSLLYYKIIG